jgi:hypothetical protein
MKRVGKKPLTNAEAGLVELSMGDLMVAVLENALDTYKAGLTSPVAAKRIEAFKVEAWVVSDDMDWPFSFLNVCRHVGVSPDVVRACMAVWRREAGGDNEIVH